MRLLLDESVPWELRHYLPHHEVFTVRYMGWNGKSNGELLALARDGFDVLVTTDQKLPYQQNVKETDVAVVILVARTNDFNDLRLLVPALIDHLYSVKRGKITYVQVDSGSLE